MLGDRNSPSFDDLQKMTLVRSCIKEILRSWFCMCMDELQMNKFCCFTFCFRLTPTSATVPRVVDEEIEICGYQIPAKVDILLICIM